MSAKLLVVDDSDEVRKELRDLLGPEGYQIVEARDGQEALDICKSKTDFDLILTDQNMPSMTGLDMLRNLRNQPPFKSTLVVFHTTEPKKAFTNAGSRLGHLWVGRQTC